MFVRPQSQPVYPTQPQHIPIPRPTPQPQQHQQQQQQQHQQQQQQQQNQAKPTAGFQKALWDDLTKTAGSLFDYQPPAQSSPKKKKSVASFTKFRTRSKDTLHSDNGFVHVESEAESEERSGSTEPKPKRSEEARPPQPFVEGDDGFEPMDTGPDTGIPDPISTQQSAKVNMHKSPRLSPMGSSSPRIPTPLSSRTSRDGGLNTLNNLGLKDSALDSMGKMAGVAPFCRSPADVGLAGLDELKDSLPFPSRASSHTPKPDLTGHLPKFKLRPDLRDLYAPTTPAEDPFVVPNPPKLPKTPKLISLESYNILVSQVEPYVTAWNNYEEKIQRLQAELNNKGLRADNVPLDMNVIMDYINRVREKDMILEESYRQAREIHMGSLEDWVNYRNAVVEFRK